MSNQNLQMQRIRRLIVIWIAEIRLNNYENYYDINKVSEHLCRLLLNKIFDHQLIDLNKVKNNFPGLDIGDTEKDLIAYQITSRTDNNKIITSLETVVKNEYEKIFTGGIRFLILNDTVKINFGPKSKKTPDKILPGFKLESNIIYPQTLIQKIEDIYEREADLLKFNEIKNLLEKEIIPIFPAPDPIPEQKIDALASLLTQAIEKISNNSQPELKISDQFFTASLIPPAMVIASNRAELTDNLWKRVNDSDALWLQGAPAMGKTTLAVLLSKKANGAVLWIECRDIAPEQLMEHILTLLSRYYQLDIGHDYSIALDLIFTSTVDGTFIILNDVPDLHKHTSLSDQLGQFIAKASAKSLNVLVTSNFSVPDRLTALLELNINVVSVPVFEVKDTENLLTHLGAPNEAVILLSKLVTEVTQGHPLLIRSVLKFLRENTWEIGDQVLIAIFSGKFGDGSQREIYARVLEQVTDAETRELLYRLQCVTGTFSLETIQLLSSVSPVINHPAEKLNPLTGIWLQKNTKNSFQLSPLIKTLTGNLSIETTKEINKKLGFEIIEKKIISQIDASKAILYFSLAKEFNESAFVLLKVLFEFTPTPKLFFDWGFNLFWFYTPLPADVMSIIKVQIRVFQINICLNQKKDTEFLVSDLQNILLNEEVGLLGHALSNMIFFQINLKENPLLAMNNLVITQSALKEIDEAIPEIKDDLGRRELLNGIWIIFSHIHKKQDYEQWFNLFKALDVPVEIIEPGSNQLYIMAAVSIYRNAVLKNKDTDENIKELFYKLISLSEESGVSLLSTYSLKFLAKYYIEKEHDFASAVSLIANYEKILVKNPIYKFLLYAEIGSAYFLAGEIDEAEKYMKEVRNIVIPAIYTEKLEYLIYYLQIADQKKLHDATEVAHEALKIVVANSNYVLEDKIKLYGESAIASINQNKLFEALNLYEQGYKLLMDNFNNSEEQQALVIRYGNALKYLNELIEFGKAESFGEGGNVIPKPGYFFRTIKELLEGGYYFDERKFAVATLLQSSFETINKINAAKEWAYRSIELSQQVENAKFVPILQQNMHYLIKDKRYRQAYNVMAYIDNYYTSLKKRAAEGDALNEVVLKSLEHIKDNDFNIYFFILLPIAFSFSLDICNGDIQEKQFPEMINDAFNFERYPIKDAGSFNFAKELFEQILIYRITYQEMQKLLDNFKSEFKEYLHVIGNILLSSLATASSAFYLHINVMMTFDKTIQGMKSFYRFTAIPYFIAFWKRKLETHPEEFIGKEQLKSRGFLLIEKSEDEKKVRTLFRIFAHHLDVQTTNVQDDYMNK